MDLDAPQSGQPMDPDDLGPMQTLSHGLKRTASNRDDNNEDSLMDGDAIMLEASAGAQPISPRITLRANSRAGQPPVVIDLTGSDNDDDLMIIDPPAAELSDKPYPKRLKLAQATWTQPTIQPQARHLVDFFTLPLEVRDKIYRLLLVSQGPIHVRQLWTERIRRPSRRHSKSDDLQTRIDTAILSVCRRTAAEGTRILYSENTFLYQLRDHAEQCWPRSEYRGQKDQATRKISLKKYGHLLRHMAIELEPNRTDEAYERLMAAALGTLTARPNNVRDNDHLLPDCGPIHLRTFTITISPLWETAKNGSRFLSVISFFSQGSDVLKQLQRIHVDFLRIVVHVNSHIKLYGINGRKIAQPDRHPSEMRYDLEMTLDLRCLSDPSHKKSDDEIGFLWQNDHLIREARQQQADKMAETLRNLRRHIEEACVRPDKAHLEGKLWENHTAAVQRRREERARLEARLNGDNLTVKDDDEEDGEEDEDWRIGGEKKILIISFVEIGGQKRAYRP
ncbi:uncharacterized protein B0T15DRAFT_490728 [Chaetomium strumarium]|uniref:Uncharacterized protein n=1 Tax=Chaetomium strumarium TaxID=1170767 RepID=A0AAJ0M3Y7_9PEZI|nr:hypothetical protein B0T15DRAFT_490728 [Chaetomium strumarium]